jgi:hypothetical protein
MCLLYIRAFLGVVCVAQCFLGQALFVTGLSQCWLVWLVHALALLRFCSCRGGLTVAIASSNQHSLLVQCAWLACTARVVCWVVFWVLLCLSCWAVYMMVCVLLQYLLASDHEETAEI